MIVGPEVILAEQLMVTIHKQLVKVEDQLNKQVMAEVQVLVEEHLVVTMVLVAVELQVELLQTHPLRMKCSLGTKRQ